MSRNTTHDALRTPERPVATQKRCPGCGGSGLRVDELLRDGEKLSRARRQMLDSNRCRTCCGEGRVDA